jgi:hypothetical protein
MMSGRSGSTALPELPWNDWEISMADIEIAKHSDGRDWKLGSGAMGEVRQRGQTDRQTNRLAECRADAAAPQCIYACRQTNGRMPGVH